MSRFPSSPRAVCFGAVVPLCALLACGDGTAPERVDVSLDFCGGPSTPVFFAHQSAGAWVSVDPDASGTVRFSAAEKLAIALTFAGPSLGAFTTYVYYLTLAELEPLSGVPCVELGGLSKSVNGSVAGVPNGQFAFITLGPFSRTVNPSSSASFNLSPLPDQPLDLVAQREALVAGEVVPDRVIVRRAQNFPHNATMPVLNFGAAEAQPVATNTATISGITAGDNVALSLSFTTHGGTFHRILSPVAATNGNRAIFGVPIALTESDDVHALVLSASPDGGVTLRGSSLHYRNPADKNLALGPPLSTPTVTAVATTPSLRFRADLPAQTQYGSFAYASFTQAPPPSTGFVAPNVVWVVVTGGYAGLPTTWALEIPDLSGISGFPAAATLTTDRITRWLIGADGGPVTPFIGGPRADGTSNTFAYRTSTITASLMSSAPDIRIR